MTNAALSICYLLVWSNLNFLHNYQWITLPTLSCLVLYSFCANLPHSVIMWLIVLSLSPHNLHLLFCWVLSNLGLIWLVLMAFFYVAIRRDSVSLLKSPFLGHVHVFSCEILLISRLKRPWSCFSSDFCFLVIVVLLVCALSVLFPVAVIIPSLRFSMKSSNRCIDASTLSLMLTSHLLSFLDTHNLSMSSLGYNALCMFISFLVLWFICISSSPVNFKNGLEYLTRGTA